MLDCLSFVVIVQAFSQLQGAPATGMGCNLPVDIENGYFDMTCQLPGRNCTTTYTCYDGYLYNGTGIRYCQWNKEWSGIPGSCQAVTCKPLPDPKDGKVLQLNRTYLATATVICDEGYTYSKPSEILRCQADQAWGRALGSCDAINCPNLIPPAHGQINNSNRTYLANVTVECDEGYVYSKPDHHIRRCLANKSWSGEEGYCEKRLCPDLSSILHGVLSDQTGSFSDTLTLQCESGYTVDGPSTVTCQANGEWSTELGRCKTSGGNSHIVLAVVLPVLTMLIAIVLCVRHWKCIRTRNPLNYEQVPLAGESKWYCSFKLNEDFSGEYSVHDSPGYQAFGSSISKEIVRIVKCKLNFTPRVVITEIIQRQRIVFIEISFNQTMSEHEFTEAVKELQITIRRISRQIVYTVNPISIDFREKPKHFLAAQILHKRHSPDKGPDTAIDFNKQYIRLKLLQNTVLGPMKRDKLERPDNYQDDLERFDGKDILDEDLIQSDDYGQFILLRGRAGIGKSTLVQRLLWKWAFGDWAVKFKALFLLNLRYLMTIDRKMDLPNVLCLYSTYNTKRVIVDAEWLEGNQEKIGIILDGIDEVKNFQERWETEGNSNNANCEALPLVWCFALMKRNCLRDSTVIVSSRPFAALSLMEQTLRENDLTKSLCLVELMGLTRGRVMKFIETNVIEKRQDFVKQTLTNNPILLSVCAITFYCAALCQLLADGESIPSKLTTYTQITAYIMQAYMHRSMAIPGGDLPTMFNESMKETLKLLSRLAFYGLLSDGVGSLPHLVFDNRDFEKLGVTDTQLRKMRDIGLLMETDIQGPEETGNNQILRQFVHLSIQEFLAMAGLLEEAPDKIHGTIAKLSESEQFNMALLFLYGLAFDDETIKILHPAATTPDRKRQITHILQPYVVDIKGDLQALQIAHESQSKEVAEEVGRQRFSEGILSVKGVKLTVIDVIAMTFVIQHQPTVHTMRLEHVGLDAISVRELSNCLKNNKSLETLELNDNSFDDECLAELNEGIKKNTTLQTFILASTKLTDDGLTEFGAALTKNTSLQTVGLSSDGIAAGAIMAVANSPVTSKSLRELSLTSEGITCNTAIYVASALKANTELNVLSLTSDGLDDEAISIIGEALWENTKLKELRLESGRVTDNGVKAISAGFVRNATLETLCLYGFHVKEEGANAILDMLTQRRNVYIIMWEPDCSDELYDIITQHNHIKCK